MYPPLSSRHALCSQGLIKFPGTFQKSEDQTHSLMKLESKKKVLIISFHFPPSSLVGAKRFAFLSGKLQKQNYEVNVLTVKEKYVVPKDRSIEFSGKVHRTAMYPSYNPIERKILKKIFCTLWKRYLCIIDPFCGWLFPGLVKGYKIVKNRNIDVLIATGPPFTTMVIGFLLSKMTQAKLILDYRDPWTNHNGNLWNIISKKTNERIEKKAVKNASALVFCSRKMKDNFIERFGKEIDEICHVVTNGFYNMEHIQPLSLGESQKNVVYAGNFYGERRIKLLANAITHAIEEGIITKENFRFHVFGTICAEDKHAIKRYGLDHLVKEYPRVSHKKLIRYLRMADILYLPSGSDVKYAIPYKFFDYLSVKRPILAVAPENSAVADMMREVDCGRQADIANDESIISNFREMIIEGDKFSYATAQKFAWENIAKQYSNVIHEVTKLDHGNGKPIFSLAGAS